MRWMFRIAGVVLGLVGLVWVLQGVGLLQGSLMTGQGFWAGAGVAFLVVGAALTYLSMRSPRV